MTVVTKENFDAEVVKADRLCVVDFWASWCGPCMMLKPVLEELSGEMTNVKFCKVDVDEQMELAQRFGVQSIPTLVCMKDGQIKKTLVGYRDKATPHAELEVLT